MATAILHHPIVTDAIYAGSTGFLLSGFASNFSSFKFSALVGVVAAVAIATLELLTLKFGILVAGAVCGAAIAAFKAISSDDEQPLVTVFKGAVIGFAIGALGYHPY